VFGVSSERWRIGSPRALSPGGRGRGGARAGVVDSSSVSASSSVGSILHSGIGAGGRRRGTFDPFDEPVQVIFEQGSEPPVRPQSSPQQPAELELLGSVPGAGGGGAGASPLATSARLSV
jgi:hypothetical protein